MAEHKAKLGYIAKKEKGSGLYREIYREGVEMLQLLSGKIWSDYNEHDPGVTILENLSYTLTDLDYKASLPIKDLLQEGKGDSLESGDNALFIPSEILTTNPITAKDLRKVLIDQVNAIKNVWIEPRRLAAGPNVLTHEGLAGLYTILVELKHYEKDGSPKEDDESKVINEVKKVFYEHRNLCEELLEIRILNRQLYTMELTLSLDHEAEGEDVFAEIYFKLGDYLSQNIKVKGLWELKQEGRSVNSIFQGPRLQNGFILDRDLKERRAKVQYSKMADIIGSVQGVRSIDHFYIGDSRDYNPEYQGQIISENIFIIGDNVPYLELPNESSNLKFTSAGVDFQPNVEEIINRFNYLNAVNYSTSAAADDKMNQIEIPEGQEQNVSDYYSIRHQFPAVYAVGNYGLAKGLPARRLAQVKQFKAYLLPFDQMMANLVAQISNLYSLFNVKDKNIQSYFYQELEDMPKLAELIKLSPEEDSADKTKPWSEVLRDLNAIEDGEALSRLNHVADNLLARFGEEFPTYSLRKVNTICYNKRIMSREFNGNLLGWKRRLLQEYNSLSYNRTKAGNHKSETALENFDDHNNFDQEFTPALVRKIALLMGIENSSTRSLIGFMGGTDAEIKGDQFVFEADGFDSTSPYGTEDGHSESKSHLEFANALLDKFKRDLAKLLKAGIYGKNYEIKGHDDHFDINIKTDDGLIETGHTVHSQSAAKQAIQATVQLFRKIDKACEGMYLIEHVTLAPPFNSKAYGYRIEISNDQGNKELHKFHQVEKETLKERDKILNKIQGFVADPKALRALVSKRQTKFHIRLFHNKTVIGHSEKIYEYEKDAKDAAKCINDILSGGSPTHKISLVNHVYYSERHKVDENFFNFQMSFVLPSWPVRFQNDIFREKFDEAVYENAPAHIKHNTIWLNSKDMRLFDQKYKNWMQSSSLNDHKDNFLLDAYVLVNIIRLKIKK